MCYNTEFQIMHGILTEVNVQKYTILKFVRVNLGIHFFIPGQMVGARMPITHCQATKLERLGTTGRRLCSFLLFLCLGKLLLGLEHRVGFQQPSPLALPCPSTPLKINLPPQNDFSAFCY